MNIKKAITALLVIFTLASITTVVVREILPTLTSNNSSKAAPTSKILGTKTVAYYFHGNQRCKTCKTIESYTREAIESLKTAHNIELVAVNVEDVTNEHFIQDYKLSNRSVVLSKIKDSKELKWRRLDKVWQLVGEKERFISYIKSEMALLKETN